MSQIFPWLTLVAIILFQSIAGTNTDFPAYSSLLKSRLSITQVQLNNLAVASDAGKLFGWCSGIAAARLPLWSVLAIGSTIGSIGYGVQLLSLVNRINALSYWQFLVLQVLAGNSICWFNTACYVAAMRSFPVDYPFVVGLSTSYASLSAKVYIALAQIIIGKSLGNKNVYLLLNCVVPLTMSILASPFMKERSPVQTNTLPTLLSVLVIAGATGSFAVVETLVPVLDDSKVMSGILLAMVALVAGVPAIKALARAKDRDKVAAAVVDQDSESGVVEVREKESEQMEVKLKEGCMFGVLKLVASVEFWLYFFMYLCGATMGLVYANNLGQIAESRKVNAAILLSISSSFGFFGRLSSAPLSLFTRLV